MLWLIIVGYVVITVLVFFWLATGCWKYGQSVGVIAFTVWFWPVALPFLLAIAALRLVARLGRDEQAERRERLRRHIVNEVDPTVDPMVRRGWRKPWE